MRRVQIGREEGLCKIEGPEDEDIDGRDRAAAAAAARRDLVGGGGRTGRHGTRGAEMDGGTEALQVAIKALDGAIYDSLCTE